VFLYTPLGYSCYYKSSSSVLHRSNIFLIESSYVHEGSDAS